MNFKEFTQHRFDTLCMILLNAILLLLILFFSKFHWNDTVLHDLMQWEFGALSAFLVMMQGNRTGQGRAMDPGSKGPSGSTTQTKVTEDVQRTTKGETKDEKKP